MKTHLFKNTVLLYSCGWMKTEVIENDYFTMLVPVCLAHDIQRAHILAKAHALKDGTVLSHYCVFLWTAKNNTKTLRVDADLKKKKSGEKNLHFQTKADT